MFDATTVVQFWAKVDKGEICWLWTGRTRSGYGTFKIDGRWKMASRVAYMLLVGPIPEGLELDHIKANGCTSTLCVKAIADEHGPAHLEPVTHRENMLRGTRNPCASNARKTHCSQGHPFDAEHTYIRHRDGQERRECRTCKRLRERERYYRSTHPRHRP
jgi:hypothetical protein